MDLKAKIFLSALLLSVGFQYTTQAAFGSAYIFAPAVITSTNQGTLTTIFLNVTSGDGSVSVVGPASVGSSTLLSAQTAVAYATAYLGLNEHYYNFTYTIEDKNISVSGPSAGMAFTILAISALTGQPLIHNFTLSGTISPDGSVGVIGGVYDKVGAAKSKNLSFVMLPAAQNGSFENLIYYVSQQQYSIPIVEVANISQALGYAYGFSKPYPLGFSIYTNYNVNALPNASLTCTNCNVTAFNALTGFTLNFTNSAVNSISPKFSSAKAQMQNLMSQYMQIAEKGYDYTAADFSFLLYSDAFVLDNANNFTTANASNVTSKISNYCASTITPQLNANNYQYVIGGELRSDWANITLGSVEGALSNVETTDTVIEALSSDAEAYGWCKAANELYSLASSMNGTPVTVSPTLQSYAAQAMQSASNYGLNIYLQAAENEYKSGNYAAALYSATYASVLGNTTNNLTAAQLYNISEANVANSTFGIWPQQYALQAQFYLNEARMQSNSSKAYSLLQNAYATSLLGKSLAADNKIISSALVSAPSYALPSGQLDEIEQQIQQLYAIMVVMTAILFGILVLLIVYMLRSSEETRVQEASTPSSRKSRR
ncbi:MAG: S16 family serine protease [Candidatus Micrarchaeaceae archaeon]